MCLAQDPLDKIEPVPFCMVEIFVPFSVVGKNFVGDGVTNLIDGDRKASTDADVMIHLDACASGLSMRFCTRGSRGRLV